ncbi:MAG: type II secretion system major pseudopilin GspG [Thermoguttaceae bacterium]|jgi:general secretion pathway protein G
MKPSSSRRKRGFTLIEVLLVLVILVVLASLAVVAYGPIQKKYRVDAAKAQIGLFKTALETYRYSVDTYPSDASGLQALRDAPADLQGKWDGPYIDRDVPLDPWHQPYQYKCPGNKNRDSFDVWTVSPEGEMIGNWSEETRK